MKTSHVFISLEAYKCLCLSRCKEWPCYISGLFEFPLLWFLRTFVFLIACCICFHFVTAAADPCHLIIVWTASRRPLTACAFHTRRHPTGRVQSLVSNSPWNGLLWYACMCEATLTCMVTWIETLCMYSNTWFGSKVTFDFALCGMLIPIDTEARSQYESSLQLCRGRNFGLSHVRLRGLYHEGWSWQKRLHCRSKTFQ